MRISRQLIPPGGWKFRVGAIWIEGYSWTDLVKNILDHQKANDLQISTQEDIEDQIADENPSIIINGDKLKKKPMGVSFFNTVQSFAQFLMNWVLKGGALVDQNTANLRSQICVACHNNKPSSEVRKGCSTCNKMGNIVINSIRSKIIGSHTTTGDAKLLTCAICGCDNRISVWIPNDILLSPEDANAYPSFCWKKARLENRNL